MAMCFEGIWPTFLKTPPGSPEVRDSYRYHYYSIKKLFIQSILSRKQAFRGE